MNLIDLVQQHLGPAELQNVGQQIGADPSQIQSAVQAALPMLLDGMAQTARQPGGADAVAGAMQDHATLLGGLGGLGGLGSVLGSILGGRQPGVESGVQQASGLNSSQTRQLLAILAPIVLAALARHRQQAAAAAPTAAPSPAGGADLNGDGIPDVLQREAQQAREHTERTAPHIGGIIGKILDAATRH
ncbi:MAG: DUF937 domain-containing protein [Gemmatirosa sp.]|nr:DUF937 domain-containing protein [Gemmatirosa sp.]